jgi:hypothetical protein
MAEIVNVALASAERTPRLEGDVLRAAGHTLKVEVVTNIS